MKIRRTIKSISQKLVDARAGVRLLQKYDYARWSTASGHWKNFFAVMELTETRQFHMHMLGIQGVGKTSLMRSVCKGGNVPESLFNEEMRMYVKPVTVPVHLKCSRRHVTYSPGDCGSFSCADGYSRYIDRKGIREEAWPHPGIQRAYGCSR